MTDPIRDRAGNIIGHHRFTPPEFSADQWRALYHLLAEEAQRMDDDGREGSFDASPLRPIYNKIRDALKGG
jgi:hypothetical protein